MLYISTNQLPHLATLGNRWNQTFFRLKLLYQYSGQLPRAPLHSSPNLVAFAFILYTDPYKGVLWYNSFLFFLGLFLALSSLWVYILDHLLG